MTTARKAIYVVALASFVGPLAPLAWAQTGVATLSHDSTKNKDVWDQSQVSGEGKVCIQMNPHPDPGITTIEVVSDTRADMKQPKPEAHAATPTSWSAADWAKGDLCASITNAGRYYSFATLGAGGGAPTVLAQGVLAVPGNDTSHSANGAGSDGDKVAASAIQGAVDLQKHHIVHHNVGLVVGGDVKLYFLPDGSPVEPVPTDLTERDKITLVVLLPEGDNTIAYQLTSCPATDRTRIQGDWHSVAQAKAEFQAHAKYTEKQVDVINCGAGTVSFLISTPYGQHVTSFTLAPVYFGTFGVEFAFDLTKNGGIGTATNAMGQTVITRNTDVLGPAVIPVFALHPFGYSYEHPTIAGVLVNPMLGLDLNNITTSFFVGDNVCAWSLCLGAGVHIRKVDELTAASGLNVGDTFDTTKGPLPTEKRWETGDGGTGFFFGVTLDVNTVAKLIAGSGGSGGSGSSGGSGGSSGGSGSAGKGGGAQ